MVLVGDGVVRPEQAGDLVAAPAPVRREVIRNARQLRLHGGAGQPWSTGLAGSDAERGVKATMRAARILLAALAMIGSS